jgi:hypothetical protein
MANASALGIHPPATVRIAMGGWVHDWPFECVEVGGDMILISGYVGPPFPVAHALLDPADVGKRGLLYYPYEHATQAGIDPNSPFLLERQDLVRWLFHGREDFIVSAGPPQVPSLN